MTVVGPVPTADADADADADGMLAGGDGERLAVGLIAAINEHLSELLAFSERLALAEQARVDDLEQLIGEHATRVLQLVQGRTTP